MSSDSFTYFESIVRQVYSREAFSLPFCTGQMMSNPKRFRMSTVPAAKFYRPSSQTPPEHKASPLPVFKGSLLGPSQQWKIFHRQCDLLENLTADLKGFAFEKKSSPGTGRRFYVAAHPKHVWFRISHLDPIERCGYEVIPEGMPCKLYFDLEYDKVLNQDKDGKSLVSVVVNKSQQQLVQAYGLQSCEVINMDASTETKFSCHLVFPQAVFQDNYHVGSFVRKVCETLGGKIDVVASKGPTGFCDLSVYTKNRNFRMYTCSKLGKCNPLTLISELPPGYTQEDIFLHSLITNVEANAPVLKFNRCGIAHVLKCGHKEAVELTPTCTTSKMSSVDAVPFSKHNSGVISGGTPSPYIELDAFVTSVLPSQGFIRRWTLSNERYVTYDIGGSRFCHRIGREHRSNHVTIVVDLSRGTWWQRCYDPDCKGFRSGENPVPKDAMPWWLMDKEDEEEEMEQLMAQIDEKEWESAT